MPSELLLLTARPLPEPVVVHQRLQQLLHEGQPLDPAIVLDLDTATTRALQLHTIKTSDSPAIFEQRVLSNGYQFLAYGSGAVVLDNNVLRRQHYHYWQSHPLTRLPYALHEAFASVRTSGAVLIPTPRPQLRRWEKLPESWLKVFCPASNDPSHGLCQINGMRFVQGPANWPETAQPVIVDDQLVAYHDDRGLYLTFHPFLSLQSTPTTNRTRLRAAAVARIVQAVSEPALHDSTLLTAWIDLFNSTRHWCRILTEEQQTGLGATIHTSVQQLRTAVAEVTHLEAALAQAQTHVVEAQALVSADEHLQHAWANHVQAYHERLEHELEQLRNLAPITSAELSCDETRKPTTTICLRTHPLVIEVNDQRRLLGPLTILLPLTGGEPSVKANGDNHPAGVGGAAVDRAGSAVAFAQALGSSHYTQAAQVLLAALARPVTTTQSRRRRTPPRLPWPETSLASGWQLHE